MKKKVFILIVVLITILLFKTNVQAECTNDELRALRIEANNLQFEYELVENEELGVNPTKYYYKVKVSNVTKNLAIATDDGYYFYSDVDRNGYLLIRNNYFPGSKNKIYIEASSSTNCNREELSTKTLSIPYYNEYSKRDECKGLEEYDICKQDIDVANITEEQFLKYIEDAKKDAQNKEEKKEKEEEQILEREENNNLVNFYNKNKKAIYIGLVGMLCVIILVSIVIIKVKDKKKIKIGDKL